ncbi:MAG: LysM peptidoglycan-binding domain-containing protein [Verrucomicrobiota bacterium]
MKTSSLLITVVVMLHCAALGALFVIQGCGTTARMGTPPPAATMPTMPPTTKEAVTYPPPKPVAKAPVAKSVSKELSKALETTEYVVRSGDSIGRVAKQYGISQSEIIDLNKLSDPNKLRIGQKLILPGRLKIKAASAAPAAPAKHSAKPKAVETPVAPAELLAAAAPDEEAASSELLVPATAESVSAPALAAGKEYVVLKGDSLSRIAKKCGTKISALREANKLQGDKLKIGQKLIIPEATAVSAVSPAASAAPAASMTIPAPAESVATPAAAAPMSITSSGITHIVQPGEDINSVAKLYAVTMDEIVELNQLGANRTVKVGQRLKIP